MNSSVLAFLPSPTQNVWYLFGFVPLRAYALCIVAGIGVAVWLTARRLSARGVPAGAVTDVAIWAVPFGIVGARLYHVISTPGAYFGPGGNPLRALAIWEGGLGIWGAVALGAVGAWIGCRRIGLPLPVLADAAAPGLVLAQAVGRLGNWFNNELYGPPTDLPWGLTVHTMDPATGRAIATLPQAVHPTFLYELLWNVGVAILLIWAEKRFRLGRGRVFALYIMGYTLGRFWIEIMRVDEAVMILGARVNVWVSILVFLGGLALFLLRRGPRERLRVDEDGRIHLLDPDEELTEAKPDEAKSADSEASGPVSLTKTETDEATDSAADSSDPDSSGTSADDKPADDAPVDDTTDETTSSDDEPSDDEPAEEEPAEEEPADDEKTDDEKTDDEKTDDETAEEKSAEEEPAEEESAVAESAEGEKVPGESTDQPAVAEPASEGDAKS